MLWWVWISQLRGFWRQELSFLFCFYTWQLLALCLLTFIDVIHFYVNGAALSIVRSSTSAHQTSVQANYDASSKWLKSCLYCLMSILCLCVFMIKRDFLECIRTSRSSHLLSRRIYAWFYFFVGVGTGNFNFAEAPARFHSEVVGKHLCFCGASFYHRIMSILAVVCAFTKSHTQRV